ncbi:hypothetical protein [Thermogemmatispora carboxidivorans]|uniref:hypothetical protein n=1 Tax=Thermogemmatispora carboxidivorans TaxID=1382306 RepID=UPI00069A7AD9|nr:hypothetical protein [Thermogemmatispora carboxidivorans]
MVEAPVPPPLVTVSYPEVPSDLATRLSDLITTLQTSSGQLQGFSGRMQDFINQVHKAVEYVASISEGHSTQALLETWLLSLNDSSQSHGGMGDVASHLSSPLLSLQEQVQTVQSGMSLITDLQTNSGRVPRTVASDVQKDIDDFNNALNTISIALDGAAKLIKALNDAWPRTCATGFTPGNRYPTFAPGSFDQHMMRMSGDLSGAFNSSAGQRIINKLGEEEGQTLIALAQANGADLDRVAQFVDQGADPQLIDCWIQGGHPADVGNVGALREFYVKSHLDTLIPDYGGGVQEQVKLSVQGASAKADFVTSKAIIEVSGGPRLSAKLLNDKMKQFSVYSKIAAQTGRRVYFLWDKSSGAPVPPELQRQAARWGVTIVEFP